MRGMRSGESAEFLLELAPGTRHGGDAGLVRPLPLPVAMQSGKSVGLVLPLALGTHRVETIGLGLPMLFGIWRGE